MVTWVGPLAGGQESGKEIEQGKGKKEVDPRNYPPVLGSWALMPSLSPRFLLCKWKRGVPAHGLVARVQEDVI